MQSVLPVTTSETVDVTPPFKYMSLCGISCVHISLSRIKHIRVRIMGHLASAGSRLLTKTASSVSRAGAAGVTQL